MENNYKDLSLNWVRYGVIYRRLASTTMGLQKIPKQKV